MSLRSRTETGVLEKSELCLAKNRPGAWPAHCQKQVSLLQAAQDTELAVAMRGQASTYLFLTPEVY